MTGWVDQVVLARKADAAEIARLRAENARLREAGQAVVDDWANAEVFHEVVFEKLVEALRAALKEGGGA